MTSRRPTFIIIAVVSVLGLAFVAWRQMMPGVLVKNLDSKNRANGAMTAGELIDFGPAMRRPRKSQSEEGFVGSVACAECHAEIARTYAEHPMGQSMTTVAEATPLENYQNVSFRTGELFQYDVEQAAGQVWHQETMLDVDGKEIFHHRLPVAFALGSGVHGRSYIVDREGILTQSPISWYAHGNRWDLSPGYVPARHERFNRRIDETCLACHVGRINIEQYLETNKVVFEELSIGCERCHGPGKQHIEFHRSNPKTVPAESNIVNPAKLPTEARESVCNQCHLQGERTYLQNENLFFDYRPGGKLEENRLPMVRSGGQGGASENAPVSQVEQMQLSRCYQASSGTFGCTSCHDPHRRTPVADRFEHYRNKCLTCHSQKGCSLAEDKRREKSAADSCVECHMPALPVSGVAHTSLTDHRVLRQPEPASPFPTKKTTVTLEIFNQGKKKITPHEASRIQGLVQADQATDKNSVYLADQAFLRLVPEGTDLNDMNSVLKTIGNDIAVLDRMASMYILLENRTAAAACWKQILKYEPNDEAALTNLAILYHDRKQWVVAHGYLTRLLQVNPYHSEGSGRMVHVLDMLGKLDEAEVAAQRALALEPTMLPARQWLVDAYQRLGRVDDAKQQHQIIQRAMKAREKFRSQGLENSSESPAENTPANDTK